MKILYNQETDVDVSALMFTVPPSKGWFLLKRGNEVRIMVRSLSCIL